MHVSKTQLAVALAAAPLALAQTYTDCNPLEKTCPNDTGLEQSTFSSDFTTGSSSNASWSAAAYSSIQYGDKGAEFVIAKAGQAPTIQTDFYILFGKIEVVMQAAPGTGIVSSIVLESDDLDEIDWEFLGGDTTQVETNYFGKGNTTTYDRAIYYPVSSPQTTFHTYTIDWTSSYINFIVDGAVVRTLNYEDANGGSNFPQTPMRLKLGNWAGGAAGNPQGTVEWAGGQTDFSQAPFTMYVKSVSIQNTNPASEYEWTDKTGSYQSIKVIKGDGSSSSAGSSSGSSASSSGSSTSGTSASAKSTTATGAPTSAHSVKQVMQTDAAVSSTSSGAAPSTTVASMMSSSSPTSTKENNSAADKTTLTSMTSASGGASSSKTGSGSSAGATHSGSSNITSSLPAQQTTNAGASTGVATALVAFATIAFAFMLL